MKALAGAAADFHLRPKLAQIADKGGRQVRFCARYNPIGEIAREICLSLVEELGFAPSEFAVMSMRGGMIDKDRFKEEHEAAMLG